MAKSYRPVRRDEQFLLPPSMTDWLPPEHLVWFVLDVVAEVDTSAFHVRARTGGAGRAGFDPDMLLALLIYGYCQGELSSRQIERLCQVDVAFRVICGNDGPDHVTIARFRKAHVEAITGLFTQVLGLCARAGLGRVGIVAIDGTKIAANAALAANRGEDWLQAAAADLLAQAEQVDAAEDALFGDARGDELPEELTDPRSRAARIRQCLDQIKAEQDAEQAAEAAERAATEARTSEYLAEVASGGPRRVGSPPAGVEPDPVAFAQARLDAELVRAEQRIAAWHARAAAAEAAGRKIGGVAPKTAREHCWVRRAARKLQQAQARAAEHASEPAGDRESGGRPRRNLTDPDSRILKTRAGWIQGYNAQLAVTDDQIILAADLCQDPNDTGQFVPMMTAAVAAAAHLAAHRDPDATELPATIGTVVADAGYDTNHNLTAPGPDRLIADTTGRQLHHDTHDEPATGQPAPDATPREAMSHRLRTEPGHAIYKRRAVTVEPVNGHLKDRIRLRRFSLRGLTAANAELKLAATAANLLKIHRHGRATTA